MRILITGGCGFVGVNLTALLNTKPGVTVRCFDNESLGKREHLDDLDCEFVHGDIRDAGALRGAMAGVDQVVHLAADTRVIESIQNPRYNFEVNVGGTLNILECMRDAGLKRLINASTGGAIIGEVQGPVHEGLVPAPMSPYGASKLAVEGYCSAYSASYGVRSLSLRFSNLFGPRSFHKGSVVAAFLKQVLASKPLHVYGDGMQIRDYVYVEDVCDGIWRGLQSEHTGPIQLGSGRPVTLDDLIAEIRAVVAPQTVEVIYHPFRAGEVHSTYCDVSIAREKLGFEPRTLLSTGLRTTWDWFSAQTAGPVPVPVPA